MSFTIGYGRQSIDPSDIEAVVSVLTGDYLTQGPAVAAFEQELLRYTGARYAVAVTNGTAALHLACLAAGLKAGDVGVTQAITFAASANCIAYCGARPDLVDVDSATLGMPPDALRAYLQKTPDCKVVIPVAMGGHSSHMQEIRAVAGDRIIIEDACHALGASLADGSKVGRSSYADMTVFSFHPVKPITTGEGGAILTNRKDLYEALLLLRSHGIERGRDHFVHAEYAGNSWYHEQQCLGFNYRISDILAALGTSQMRRIDGSIEKRRQIAKRYDEQFSGLSGVLSPLQAAYRDLSGHHLYLAWIRFAEIGHTRETFMQALRDKGVGSQVHYMPVYRHPYYEARFSKADFPNAERYYEGCLTLPCYPSMSDEQIEQVIGTVIATVQAGVAR